MNNKPVAWMNSKGDIILPAHQANKEYNIPLYTHPVNPKYDTETGEPLIDGYPLFSGLPHPVKEPMMVLDGNRVYPAFKELTDEEICKIFNEHTGLGIHQKEADKADLLVFARAILRKASEK
jgi:hypothetical protein